MKIKTSELKDKALDYAVAVAIYGHAYCGVTRWEDGGWQVIDACGNALFYHDDWDAAGPIIERENIYLQGDKAFIPGERADEYRHLSYGPTPLIAAMRTFAASKLGDEVDVPEELL